MIRNLRMLGSLLGLFALLAACDEEDDPEEGADAGTATSTVAVDDASRVCVADEAQMTSQVYGQQQAS